MTYNMNLNIFEDYCILRYHFLFSKEKTGNERSFVTYPRPNSSVTTGQGQNKVPQVMVQCSPITTYSLNTDLEED